MQEWIRCVKEVCEREDKSSLLELLQEYSQIPGRGPTSNKSFKIAEQHLSKISQKEGEPLAS